jgi:hypothetical protein
MNKKEFTGNEYVIGYSTVPFQRGPPSIFIFLSVYTYATNRGCISRYDAAPPDLRNVSALTLLQQPALIQGSANTLASSQALPTHSHLPSSANTSHLAPIVLFHFHFRASASVHTEHAL